MFEVGKKYISIRDSKSIKNTYECVHVGKVNSTFVPFIGAYEILISNDTYCMYEEYKEPLKGKGFVNIMQNDKGNIWFCSVAHSRENADEKIKRLNSQRIACIEFDWVEGNGL